MNEQTKKYRRTDLYIAIAGNDSVMPEAAGVDLDIACDDMKDELQTRLYRLREGVILAAFICFFHIAMAVTGIACAISIPGAILFSCIIISYSRIIQRLIALSEATTHIITERENVPPYSLATGVYWF